MKQSLLIFLTLVSLLAGWRNGLAQPHTSVSGRVLGYLSNRIGDYDGLRIRTTSGEVRLHFPPHTAAKIRQLATVGTLVEATVDAGHNEPDLLDPEAVQQPGGPAYRLVRLRSQASGAVVQLADLPPPPPHSGKLVQAEGPIVGHVQDEAGQLAGLLTDRYLIELKPHQCEQIGSLLTGVQRLSVVGYERPLDGFVNRSGKSLIHPTALTIKGQTFAL